PALLTHEVPQAEHTRSTQAGLKIHVDSSVADRVERFLIEYALGCSALASGSLDFQQAQPSDFEGGDHDQSRDLLGVRELSTGKSWITYIFGIVLYTSFRTV